jgi:uncharacterized protein YukE
MTVQALLMPLQESNRRFFRQLFGVMESQGVTVENLLAMLKSTEMQSLWRGAGNMDFG